jgi:Fe-S-cluster formation regulator IscX/YfhJ
MLGTLDNDPTLTHCGRASASGYVNVPLSPTFDYQSITQLDNLDDYFQHGRFGSDNPIVSSSAPVDPLPPGAVQTSLPTPGTSDYTVTPSSLLPRHGSPSGSMFSASSMTTASSDPFEKTNAPSGASTLPFPAVSNHIMTPGRLDDDPTSRLEKVLDAIDDAGFDSVESMMALYYASAFPAGSSLSAAQSLSKEHRLQRLLSTLHEVSRRWDHQEVQGYRESVIKSAKDISRGTGWNLEWSIHGAPCRIH